MVERVGWTLVHFVWEGAAVAAILGVALTFTRRESVRYALALVAFAALAALPVATFLALGAPTTAPASGTLRSTTGAFFGGAAVAPEASRMTPLVGLWALGVLLLSLRLVGTLLHLERWRRRHARPASPNEQAHFEALARRLGLRRRVALFLSDRIEVPSAWGVLRPVVVLPASLVTGLPPAQVEGVLLHELAHIRRHDYLVNLLQGVVETALFYHPAVWWVSSIVRRERERLCDDVVVAALGDPMPYARALLQLEERRRAPRPALSAKEGDLMNRIARLLAPAPAPARLSPLAPSLAALAVVALALGGTLHAEAQSARPTPKKADKAGSTQSWHRPGLDVKVVAVGDALRVVAQTKKSIAVGYYRVGDGDRAWHQPDIDLSVHPAPEDRKALRIVVHAGKSNVVENYRVAPTANRRVESIEAELRAVEAQLAAAQKSEIDAQTKAGADKNQARANRLRILAAQDQAESVRKRLDETQRAIERIQTNDRQGPTYGMPGKPHLPVWKAEDFPQGVGVLTAPASTDALAFTKAQAELSYLRPAQSALKPAIGPKSQYVTSVVVDPKIRLNPPPVSKPYQIEDQIQSPAKGIGSPIDTEAVQRIIEATQDARRDLLTASAVRAQVSDELKRTMDSTRAESRSDLARAVAVQHDALKRTNAEISRALTTTQIKELFGSSKGSTFQWGASSGPGFGKGGFGKAQGGFGAGTGGFKKGSQNFGGLQSARGWSLFESPSRFVTPGPDGTVNVDCEGASFKKVLRGLIAQSGGSLVIAPGDYKDVNVILNGVSFRKALEVLCEAAGATLRQKDGVYLVGPKG